VIPHTKELHTDWAALLLSLFAQVPVVVWLFTDDAIPFVFLGPFELVRLIVLCGLARAYNKYEDPLHAAKTFVVWVGTLLTFFIALLVGYSLSVRGLDGIMGWVLWRLLPLCGVLIVETAVSLYFFRGNVRVQAARLDAMASDATTWFTFGFLVLPFILGVLLLLVALLGTQRGLMIPPVFWSVTWEFLWWVPVIYFAGKALVLAQVYTARFAYTGERVLDAAWILFITSSRSVSFDQQLDKEQHDIAWRRAAMRGEPPPDAQGEATRAFFAKRAARM